VGPNFRRYFLAQLDLIRTFSYFNLAGRDDGIEGAKSTAVALVLFSYFFLRKIHIIITSGGIRAGGLGVLKRTISYFWMHHEI
jgi:hypothetical protein